MTLEEARAKADEDFKDPATKRFWMDQVNALLEKSPGMFGSNVKHPITPEQIDLPPDAVKVPAEVQFKHAFSYFYNVPPNYTEAVRWFRMAAEQGHCRAQGYLGQCYAKGEGVTKDEVESAKWYRQAAEQGDDLAQYILGYCFANGQGVAKDLVESAKWYRKAAEQGHIKAKAKIGELESQASKPNNVPQIKPQALEQIGSFFDKNLNQLEKNILSKVVDGIKILLWIVLILFIIYAVINFIDHIVFDSSITGGPYDDGRNSMN